MQTLSMPLQASERPLLFRLLSFLERFRVRTHLRATEALLRSRSNSHLSHKLKERRGRNLDKLNRYWKSNLFPLNLDFPSKKVPYFIDAAGTPCAMAHLIAEDGQNEHELTEQVSRENNHVYINDIHDGPVLEWIRVSGLTKAEAARIQPTYGPCGFGGCNSIDPIRAIESVKLAMMILPMVFSIAGSFLVLLFAKIKGIAIPPSAVLIPQALVFYSLFAVGMVSGSKVQGPLANIFVAIMILSVLVAFITLPHMKKYKGAYETLYTLIMATPVVTIVGLQLIGMSWESYTPFVFAGAIGLALAHPIHDALKGIKSLKGNAIALLTVSIILALAWGASAAFTEWPKWMEPQKMSKALSIALVTAMLFFTANEIVILRNRKGLGIGTAIVLTLLNAHIALIAIGFFQGLR